MLVELPRYGDGHISHVGSGDSGECIATYTAVASADDVLLYYEEQLPNHAWAIVRRSGPHDVPRSLQAARDKLHYYVGVTDEGHDEVPVTVLVTQ